MTDARRGAILTGGAASLLCLATLALYWPGFASYDTVIQYGQLLSGQVDDWHPPVMVRLWALLGGRTLGTAPMFVLQMGLYWLGLGLIATRLAQGGRTLAAGAVLALGLLPPVFAWQVIVLKDGQMMGAMIAAAGIAAWWRLAGRSVPWPAWGVIVVLLVYAALVRANGAFAAIPLGVMLAGRPRATIWRALAMLGLIAATIGLSPFINRTLLGATDSGVAQTLPMFDLAGIAARLPGQGVAGLGPDAASRLKDAGCVTPLYWDPLGSAPCAEIVAPWQRMHASRLNGLLAATALRHPFAYTAHRLAHVNSTERWLVPARWPGVRPIDVNQPNTLGLVAPGPAATRAQRLAIMLDELPLAWPFIYVGLLVLAVLRLRGAPSSREGTLVLALAVSALALEASFLPVSVASDLRYHVWPMLAACLALVLPPRATTKPAGRLAIGLLLALIAAALAARLTLHLPASLAPKTAAPISAPAR